jgi:hypothetical protein
VFVGGVLCTLLAWVMENQPFMVRVRAGAEARYFPSACFSCTRKVMAEQEKSVHKKSMGRPPGVKYGGTIPARFEIQTMEALDVWAVKHKVSRSEAIRRLVEIGLKAKGPKA